MPRVSDEFLQKIADGRAGSRCDCPAYWQRRDEARELIAARVVVREAKRWRGCECRREIAVNKEGQQMERVEVCTMCAALGAYDEATK